MREEKKNILKNYLENGLINEIFLADESFFILQTITKHWSKLSQNNFGVFFNSLYSAHFIRYSLALTKLFDKPHPKYEVVSLPTVLSYVKDNFLDEPIQENFLLAKQFSVHGYEIHYLTNLQDGELARLIVEYFEQETPVGNYTGNIQLERILEIIRFYRDKHYAHRENINPNNLPKTTFEDSQQLLTFAKSFVATISLAYLSTIHSVDGEDFILSDDAKMTNNAFLRILESANILKSD